MKFLLGGLLSCLMSGQSTANFGLAVGRLLLQGLLVGLADIVTNMKKILCQNNARLLRLASLLRRSLPLSIVPPPPPRLWVLGRLGQ